MPRRTSDRSSSQPRGRVGGRAPDRSGDAPEKADTPDGPDKIDKNYITPAGYKRLADEFDFLRSVKRPEVVSALSDAAAEGDRSENAEYIYRKRQLRDIDRRLRFLGKRLEIIAVVDPREQKQRARVFFGATVTVEDDDGRTDVYRIVGEDEIDGKAGHISWKSPIGRALLGKGLDDTVTVKWHAGRRELTILEVEYK